MAQRNTDKGSEEDERRERGKDLTQRAQSKPTAKTPASKPTAGGRYKVKTFRRVWLFYVGFLFDFWGFQALAYFGFFASFYFYGMGLGHEAFGFED
jgi:hypothetical protein